MRKNPGATRNSRWARLYDRRSEGRGAIANQQNQQGTHVPRSPEQPQSFSPGPTSDVLEELAFGRGCALFVACIGSGIALQRPQGPLNRGRDAFAFLVDRRTVRG